MKHATIALLTAAALAAGCTQMSNMMGGDRKSGEEIRLTGGTQVPPVNTPASGSGTVTVNADRTVVARIVVVDMTPTAAHIHQAAAGANGPVIVPFVKQGDNVFVAPEGAKMTEDQYRAYKAGNTYVNVHSAKNPSGEVRAQLKGN